MAMTSIENIGNTKYNLQLMKYEEEVEESSNEEIQWYSNEINNV